ncbi:MAG: hypothetical protein ABIK26_05585, partial [Candidatus Omnitrophota bacterium]
LIDGKTTIGEIKDKILNNGFDLTGKGTEQQRHKGAKRGKQRERERERSSTRYASRFTRCAQRGG